MGLDVYVGSLTRYFARDWQTILQQLAATGEIPPVEIMRPEDPPDVVTDPEQIRAAVLVWREGLSKGLAPHVAAPLTWDEAPGTPYFTDKPSWDCYGAIHLPRSVGDRHDARLRLVRGSRHSA